MPNSFYVSAHPDDAILFRGEQLYLDLHTPGVGVVHIAISAGDAGRTDGWWQRREEALVRAMAATMDPNGITKDTVSVGGRSITRYSGRGWWLYCLRVPDGGLDGNGYSSTGYQSLSKLKAGTRHLSPVDGSPAYSSWSELVDTLRVLVRSHRVPDSYWINGSDPSASYNPGDHPDHYASSAAVQTVAQWEGMNRWWWVSYDSANRAPNLGGLPLERKRFLFASYGWNVGSPDEWEWRSWGDRSYGRAAHA